MIKITDTHSHTSFSPDSRMSIQDAALWAEKSGLAGIAFTDHLDLKAPGGDMKFAFDPAEQQEEIERVKRRARVELYNGIEVGLQHCNLKDIKDFLNKFSFDTVIASIHFVDGVDPYEGEYYIGKSEKEAYGRYMEIMLELIKEYPDFDILGHFDYIARYSPYKTRAVIYRSYADILDEIFRYLIYNGKCLEINTNTYRYRNGATPELDFNILLRYKELGGSMISIGSDAHTRERIGESFEAYTAMVKRTGFNYVVHFCNRRAVFTKI